MTILIEGHAQKVCIYGVTYGVVRRTLPQKLITTIDIQLRDLFLSPERSDIPLNS